MEKIKNNVEKAFYERHKQAMFTPVTSKIEGSVVTLKMMAINDYVLRKSILIDERSDARLGDDYISFGSHFIKSFKSCRCEEIAVVSKRGKVIILCPMLDKPIKSYDDFGDEVWTFKNPNH